MQWWTDLTQWLLSPGLSSGAALLITVFVSVIIGGIIAGLISRAAVKSLYRRIDDQKRRSLARAVIKSAVDAGVWTTLSTQEQAVSSRNLADIDINLRLLPEKQSGALLADWIDLLLGQIRSRSVTYGYEIEPLMIQLRDRLVQWQRSPKKLRVALEEDVKNLRLSPKPLSPPAPTPLLPTPDLPATGTEEDVEKIVGRVSELTQTQSANFNRIAFGEDINQTNEYPPKG